MRTYITIQQEKENLKTIQTNNNKNNNDKCTESNHYHINVTKQ